MFYLLMISVAMLVGFVFLAQFIFDQLNKQDRQDANQNRKRKIIAFRDAGEINPQQLGFNSVTTLQFPSNESNLLFDLLNRKVLSILENFKKLRSRYRLKPAIDFIQATARKLDPTDYSIDAVKGILSLAKPIGREDGLAIAFEYEIDGRFFRTGAFSDQTLLHKGDPLVVKLLQTGKDPANNLPSLMLNREEYFEARQKEQIIRYHEHQHFFLASLFKGGEHRDIAFNDIKINRSEVWVVQEPLPFYRFKKYPAADVFRHRSIILRMSFVIAIGLVLLAFSWPTYEYTSNRLDGDPLPDEPITMIAVNTVQEKEVPKPMPEELPKKEEKKKEIIKLEKEVKKQQKEEKKEEEKKNFQNYHTLVDTVEAEKDTGEDEIIDISEVMPEFPGGDAALMKFMGDKVKYPPVARDGIEGLVVLSFVVEKDGSISNIKILRDIGGGCGAAVVRAAKLMPNWKPGRQGGRKVRVRFTLPFRFRLK